jgi:hypothetical protein
MDCVGMGFYKLYYHEISGNEMDDLQQSVIFKDVRNAFFGEDCNVPVRILGTQTDAMPVIRFEVRKTRVRENAKTG